jgi:hypothetical protein
MSLCKIVKYQAGTVQNRTRGTKVGHRADHEQSNLIDMGVENTVCCGLGGHNQIDEGKQGTELNVSVRWMPAHGIQSDFDAAKIQNHGLLGGNQSEIHKGPASHGLEI